MTTKVTVAANHGWPVDVTPISVGGAAVGPKQRVAADEVRDFCVHSGQDLLIHEVQSGEIAAESIPHPETL
ncbi:MAG: hypothetical protein ACOH2H_15290 [Cypionkella sp.]